MFLHVPTLDGQKSPYLSSSIMQLKLSEREIDSFIPSGIFVQPFQNPACDG